MKPKGGTPDINVDTGDDTTNETGEDQSDQSDQDQASESSKRGLIAARRAEAKRAKDAEARATAAEAKLAAHEAAKVLADGEAQERLAALRPEHDALQAKFTALQASETARLELVKEANATRLAELPEAMAALIPEVSMTPDEKARYLSKLEKAAQKTLPPIGGRNNAGGAGGTVKPPVALQAEVTARWQAAGGTNSVYADVNEYWSAMRNTSHWRNRIEKTKTT